MRILHVGSGFRPWRRGGLVAYCEDLMQEQVRRGHEVSYFFSGRQYPYVTGPRLRRWERDGVAMLEVVNSPLYDHGRQPELEVEEPGIERMLARLIGELRPNLVHVQELAGLPSSVLDVAGDSGLATVATLQDYFPLCSTFKLLDSNGEVCLRTRIGQDCAATTAVDQRGPSLMFEATVGHEIRRLPLIRRIDPARRDPRVLQLARVVARAGEARRLRHRPPSAPEAFQRRRDMNVERLNRADRVIAMSHRAGEIYSLLGVDSDRLRTLQLTLEHIEHLRPRRPQGTPPVTFATLGGGESVAKGSRLLLDATRSLSDAAAEGRFRLLIFGFVDPAVADEVREMPGVELRGGYPPGELDRLLAEVDVGIMPSIWEEAYGYAGVEFLAKGIPVIATAIGGMVEYTREGQTGWLNHSRSPEELARIMLDVIEHPKQIADLNAKLRAQRDTIVKPLSRHAEELEALYGEAIAERRRAITVPSA